jgi:hypothetical protein
MSDQTLPVHYQEGGKRGDSKGGRNERNQRSEAITYDEYSVHETAMGNRS